MVTRSRSPRKLRSKSKSPRKMKSKSKSPRRAMKSKSKSRSPRRVARMSKSRSPRRMARKSKSRSPRRVARMSKSRSPRRVMKSKSKSPRKMKSKSKSKSPRKMKSKSKSKSPRKARKTRKVRSASKKRSPNAANKWIHAHKAQIRAAVAAKGMTGKKGAFLKVAAELRKAEGYSPAKKATVVQKRAALLKKLASGTATQSAEAKMRAMFSRPLSSYSPSGRVRRVRKAKKARTGPKRAPTKFAAYIHHHRAAIQAEVKRQGMEGKKGALFTVASQMYRTA